MADQKEPKKETVRITLPPFPAGQSPAPGTGAHDTVRINLLARAPDNGTAPRPPSGVSTPPPRPPILQAPLPPAPSKAVAPPPLFRPAPVPPSFATGTGGASSLPGMPRPAPVSPQPAPIIPASTQGPKKETARISVSPNPPARPSHTVEMKKTQPLVTMPEPASQPTSVIVTAPTIETIVEDVPMVFCWSLLAASTVILLIQIWNYFG
jgi:hypothetical protein